MRTVLSPVLLLTVLFASRAGAESASTNAAATEIVPAATGNAKKRLDMVKEQPISATSIFDGDTFPKIDLYNKNLVHAAVGPYTLSVRFFDAKWNEVTAPKEPGRYGAWLEFKDADGTFTRHVTLFKTAHPYSWAKNPGRFTVTFPSEIGLPEATVAQEQWNIENWIGSSLNRDITQDDHEAILFAALQDIASDPARWHGFNVRFIDNAWWEELRKRLGITQEYKYLTYLPDDYDKDQHPWPLLLFLHGSGERGDDLSVLKNNGPLGYIHKGHPLPFIVITPQCPDDESWEPARLAHLIDEVAAEKRVDPKRIYVTGLSMGGYGAFDIAALYPDKIAAIAPLSGGETPELAERLKKMPIWNFHGADDTTVPARYSVDLVHALQKLGAPVKLTVYPGVGHERWDVTYSDPALYTWFLEHSR